MSEFVDLLEWVVREAGGAAQVTASRTISADALRRWRRGDYPRQRESQTIGAVDRWARGRFGSAYPPPPYPAGGLLELARTAAPGPAERPLVPAERPLVPATTSSQEPPASTSAPVDPPLAADDDPAPARGRSSRRWALLLPVLVGSAALGAVAWETVGERDRAASATPVVLAVPQVPGAVQEQTVRFAAPTFTDPNALDERGPSVPPYRAVNVSCRVYAPSIPSVSPDGWWYRLADAPWNDRYYAAANVFANGDRPGQALHNTDLVVPVCP